LAERMPNSKRRRRRRISGWWHEPHWYVLVALAAVSFVLGTVGFQQWFALHDNPGTFFDAVYSSIGLFTMNSGYVDQPIPLSLGIGRYLAFFTFVYGASAAVLAVFGERISRFGLRTAKDHAVVCGLGERGLYIAERLLERDMRVAVVERDEHAPLLDRAREAGAVAVIGDASDPAVLRNVRAHRARYVVAACAEDGENAEIAARLASLVKTEDRIGPVTAIAHVYDSELCSLLREGAATDGGSGGFRLVFFNVPESGARAMLDTVPPTALDRTRSPHIVVVGLGKLGRSLVLQVARTWAALEPMASCRPRITVIDQAAAMKVELLRIRYPALDQVCELDARQMEKSAPEFERGDFLYERGRIAVDAVYMCPDDDVHALVMALTVLRHTRGSGVPIAVRMNQRSGFAALIDAEAVASNFSDLRAVGILDATCDVEVLLGEEQESTGQAVAQP
jgi:hypothetical protein